MENIINSIIAISTVATLIVIWLTLKEMKVQRHKIFEPIIIPLNFDYYFLCKFPQIILPIDSSTEKGEVFNSSQNISNLKFKNIGQGIAKNILLSIHWNKNFKDCFDFLGSELVKNEVNLKVDITDSGCWISMDELNNVNSGGNFPYEFMTEHKIDYLLPIKDNDESGKVEIPSSIELMFKLLVLLMESASRAQLQELFKIFKDKFEININIRYQDNLDKYFTSNFTLILTMPKIQMNSNYIGKLYTFRIERKYFNY